MGEKRNYAALDWIIGEISETLNDARQSLEAYVEDPRDAARIRFCLTHIHQVHGSLQMVEFHGASLFAEEMESLAEALMNSDVTNEKEAQEALMRSLLQLPIYLEQVKNSQEDHPGAVLPLLNDLRAVRKQSYLSETNLFTPDLSSLERVRGERHEVLSDTAKLKQIVHKLREMYQYAAASVLRGIKIDENLGYIEKVLTRLEGVSRGTKCYPIWQVSSALIEALVRDDVELSIAVRGLLRYIARELRILEEHCPAAFDAPARETLLRNLLYYVARAKEGGTRTNQVKRQYNLDKALLGGLSGSAPQEQGLVSPPEPDAIRSVVVALLDELNTCKHLLDSALSGHGSLSDIEQMMPYVKRIGDTLAVLGIGEMRKQMIVQYESLQAICDEGTYTDIQLIDIAGALANIENRLEAIAKGAGKIVDYANVDERTIEIDSAKEAVLGECRAGLEQVKESIVESLSTQWDPTNLPAAVETLHKIQGGLNMVPLERAAHIMGLCGDYIEKQLVNSATKPGDGLQTLAEAIASVDYYLERLTAGLGDDLDAYLGLAEECLEQLGYEMASSGSESISVSTDDEEGSESEVEFVVEEEGDVQPREQTATLSPAFSPEPELPDDPDRTQIRPALTDDLVAASAEAEAPAFSFDEAKSDQDEHRLDPAEPETHELGAFEQSDGEPLEEHEASDQEEWTPELDGSALSDAASGLAEPAADEVSDEQVEAAADSAPAQAVENAEDEDDLIDDEIIEIFVEEAGEVLETLQEYFPQWCNNVDDQEALTTVRRAFHTLKGSGRMVEALDVGELAWTIENMLNRVIDGSITPAQPHIQLIAKVIEIVPALVQAFEKRTPNPVPEQHKQYIAWGERLSQGEVPEELMAGHDFDTQAVQGESEELVADEQEEDNEDQVLWEIFASEANTHLAEVDEFIRVMEQSAPLYSPPSDVLQRALHTLKGSAHMAAVTPIASLITPLEGFVKELRSYQVSVDEDILQLIGDAATYTREGLEYIYQKEPVQIAKLDQFVARVQELLDSHITPLVHLHENSDQKVKKVDPRLLSVIMAEEMALLLDADVLLQKWQQEDEADTDQWQEMKSELHALADASEQAHLPVMRELANCLADVYDGMLKQHIPLNDDTYTALGHGHENLLDMVDQVAAGQDVQATRESVMIELQRLLDLSAALGEAAITDITGESVEEQELEAQEVESTSEEEDAFAMEFDPQDLAEAGVTDDDEETLGAEFTFDLVEDDATSENSAESEEPHLEEIVLVDEDFDLSATDTDVVSEGEAEGTMSFDADDMVVLDSDDTSSASAEDLSATEEIVSDGDLGVLPEIESSESDTGDVIDDSEISGIEAASLQDDSEEMLDTVTDSSLEESLEDDGIESTPSATVESDEEADWESIDEDAEVESLSDDSAADAPLEPSMSDTADVSEVEPGAVVDIAGVGSSPIPASEVASMTLAEIAHIAEDDFDEDILEIFLEEAGELVEELDEAIHDWEASPDSLEQIDTMKRALHTLKGGARLSGLMNLGELTHEFESFVIQNSAPQSVQNYFQILLAYQDRIHNGVKAVRARLDGEPLPKEPTSSLAAALSDDESAASGSSRERPLESQTDTSAPKPPADSESDASQELGSASKGASTIEPVAESEYTQAQVVPFDRKTPATPAVAEDGDFVTPSEKSPQAPAQKRHGSQEMIKVSADLLEELVNLAGETSISRGRLEQQVSDLSGAVDEVDGTLSRLNEQLRRLDIETEAQVLFRQEQMAAHHEDFDPLEMDRYSQLQQLTRSLMESASDLMDLKGTLNDKIRDTETLLLQQSRINSALQEGLMRSRMVPFSRLVPRLRRIVRQVASELGKHVNFELDNVEGEMDRSVLERMVAPLEHMLRNAVDHGIEMPDVRVGDGKPETGRILLSLAREGGDILLRLADDGRGINLDRVREKAIERGLMADDSNLSDHDVMQFILQAGFSTAENVTQISGRGVGMDVVAAEIKQLGGSIVIDSKAGVGSQFTVRLPFTVSVNRALMVQINTEQYAIPLNSIEGIVRVSPFELEHYFSHPEARFEYAGENYQVRHLGAILNDTPVPKMDGHVLPLPVILVRSAQHTMALQVDALMGSREIVVKSLGPQFAAVQGLSGATVMGDGSVVVILDPHALVRREVALASIPAGALEADGMKEKSTSDAQDDDKNRVRTIMVVDDSVTVRKVTSRFLEREGFNVITAKDGVDALQVLQDELPDLMLLDIEMPRMDGFEVAKNVRSTSRLKHLPIIMITSRTGDKHRQHALSIGVNDYVGKPYQEEQLLKTMSTLLYAREDKQA